MPTIQTSRKRYDEFRRDGLQKQREKEQNENLGLETERGKPEPTAEEKAAKRLEQKAKRRRYLKQYAFWVLPYKWPLLGLFALSIVAAAMDMVGPWLLAHTMDEILSPAERGEVDPTAGSRELIWVCGIWFVLLIAARVVATIRWYGTLSLNSQLIARMRKRLHRRLMNLSIGNIHELKTGKIVSRLSGDVGQSMGLLQQGLLSPAAAVVRLVMTIGILYAWNWRLALAATAILPPVLYLSTQWINRVRPIFKSAGEDRNETDARVTETFSGIRVVRAFRREAKEMRDASLGYNSQIRKNLYAHRVAAVVDVFWELLMPLTTLAIIFIGGLLLLSGVGLPSSERGTTVGQIVAFNAYTGMLLWPMWQIVGSMNQTQQSLAAMERVFEIFDMPLDKIDPPDAIAAPREVRELRFERVGFQYRPDVPIIKDFSLVVPGGSVVALVGASGAGKTTMTDLIARFYDPTSGAILLNGIDIKRMQFESYKKLLAVVQQETFLFDGTVRDNIAYGRRNASDEEVTEAAKRANAHAFITELPEGYKTLIGERGVKLSGGQRQRISIARAILADPQILVLDEATSNLDTESEQLIQAALNELYKSRTTFVIAHRLSTVTHADIIVVMEKGSIVEVGTHVDLMARGGAYAAMVDRQRQFAFDEEKAFGAA